MKKLGFLFPLLFILMFAVITPKFFSGSINAGTMLMFSGALLLVLLLLRPKKSASKSAADTRFITSSRIPRKTTTLPTKIPKSSKRSKSACTPGSKSA